jgi:hypothetical protein
MHSMRHVDALRVEAVALAAGDDGNAAAANERAEIQQRCCERSAAI